MCISKISYLCPYDFRTQFVGNPLFSLRPSFSQIANFLHSFQWPTYNCIICLRHVWFLWQLVIFFSIIFWFLLSEVFSLAASLTHKMNQNTFQGSASLIRNESLFPSIGRVVSKFFVDFENRKSVKNHINFPSIVNKNGIFSHPESQ